MTYPTSFWEILTSKQKSITLHKDTIDNLVQLKGKNILKYSVVIPVHNGERTIERAIHSALSQTIPPQKLIVFDNASTDNTLGIAVQLGQKNHRIKVIQSETKLNPLESFRSSIANVEGLFLWLAADDILLPDAIHDLWQSRCNDQCTHAIGHRVVFFDEELRLTVGKNFSNTAETSDGITKFLEFPADNSIFYSLTEASRARMILPKSEMYAWDWVYSARLLTEPFHYQNVKVGLLREQSPLATYKSQASSSIATFDRIFPLRKASREFLRIPSATNWSKRLNIAILNVYMALVFGSISSNGGSLVIKSLRNMYKFVVPLLNNTIKWLTRLMRGIFHFVKPFLSIRKRQYIAKRFKIPRPISGFLSLRFGSGQINEVPGLKGLEFSSLDLANIPPFAKTSKKIDINPSEFNAFADLVALSNFFSTRSVFEIEVENNFRSENQARIYSALVKYDLISNINLVKRKNAKSKGKSSQVNINGITDFGIIEWKNIFNKTATIAVRKTGKKQKVSRKVLVCLAEIPVPTRDSGSNDIIFYLLLLTNLGHEVTVCVPHKTADRNSLRLLESICQVKLYSELTPNFDEIIVYGPYAYQLFYELNFYQDYIYIMIDAVFRRFRQNELAMNSADSAILEFEKRAILGSRVSLAISQRDFIESQEEFPNSTFELFPIVRNFETDKLIPKKDPERILFVGSLSHTPNSEALNFILKEIAPRVNELHPNLIFTIVGKGSDMSEVFSENVQTLGMIPNLDKMYSESIVSLAPMTIAAGINGKVMESINFGVFSLVSTTVSANLTKSMRKCTVVCESAEEYVDAISDFYLQKRRIPQSLRLAVAEEIDGCLNAVVLRKYIK
jgi:glycosyltransferase involved in cell wall biosynthesis